MTEMMSDVKHAEYPKPESGLDERLIDQARAGGLKLTGEGGVTAPGHHRTRLPQSSAQVCRARPSCPRTDQPGRARG
jgi:hypothetical protein